MIKLLADENFPSASIEILNQQTDTLSILKYSPGISGQLIFKDGIIPENGILFFRLQSFTPTTPAKLVIELLNNSELNFKRSITVIEEHFIRQTKF